VSFLCNCQCIWILLHNLWQYLDTDLSNLYLFTEYEINTPFHICVNTIHQEHQEKANLSANALHNLSIKFKFLSHPPTSSLSLSSSPNSPVNIQNTGKPPCEKQHWQFIQILLQYICLYRLSKSAYGNGEKKNVNRGNIWLVEEAILILHKINGCSDWQ